MPYKINTRGYVLAVPSKRSEFPERERAWKDLTTLQQDALLFLALPENQEEYSSAGEVAAYWNYPNGQYFRGPLASLHKRGLIDKFD